MATTIYDIAKDTGFSPSTVSLVLNKKETNVRISKKTKDKILGAAGRLEYHPNSMARSLRIKKSYNIGVVFGSSLSIINDVDTSDYLSGIGIAIGASTYNMSLLAGYEKVSEKAVNLARANMVDGLLYIVYSSTYDQFHHHIAAELGQYNVGYFGIQSHSSFINPNCVCLQAAAGCRLAVEHLHKLGNKEIGLINTLEQRHISTPEIVRGFTEAARESGIVRSVVLNRDDYLHSAPEYGAQYRYDNGFRLATYLVKKKQLLESYFIYADVMAMGFIDGLKAAGVKVPQDVRLVGFGNTLTKEKGVDFLTSIDACRVKSGKLAARALIDILEKQSDFQQTEPIMVEPTLVVRKSCGSN